VKPYITSLAHLFWACQDVSTIFQDSEKEVKMQKGLRLRLV
jgi:hypothetical protein